MAFDLAAHLRDVEREYIEAALLASGGQKKGAADRLGLKRTTLIEKMKRLGMPMILSGSSGCLPTPLTASNIEDMADKKPILGPVTLVPPKLPASAPPATPPLRAVKTPETCCFAHDAESNKHDVECIVGMIYRVHPEALDALFEGFTHAVGRAADTLADAILSSQTGAQRRVTPATVHAAIDAFNKLREKAIEAQSIVRDRESGR